MKNFKYYLIIFFFTLSVAGSNLYSQISLPDDGEVDDAPAAPIDGLISLAIAFGIYGGIKKLKGDTDEI